MAVASQGVVRLSSGHDMPLLGLGCSRNTGQSLLHGAVETALDAGYRHIDTAYFYGNEEEIGENIARWIQKGGGKRKDVFVTTKLPTIGMTPAGVDKFLRLSLKKLGLDYVDLYLVHSPCGMVSAADGELISFDDKKQIRMDYGTDLIAVWKAMEAAVDAGLARSIGVSNCGVRLLRKTLAVARIPPAVLQVELHVRYQQPQLADFCRQHNIALTAYGPLGSPGRQPFSAMTKFKKISLLDDPVVQLVADNHKVSTAQVLLRYWVQQGVSVIPKSTNPARIASNGRVFEFKLSETEMAALKSLDLGREGKMFLIKEDSNVRLHPEFEENC